MPRERMTGPPRGSYTEPGSEYHGARDRMRTGKTGPGRSGTGRYDIRPVRFSDWGFNIEYRHLAGNILERVTVERVFIV